MHGIRATRAAAPTLALCALLALGGCATAGATGSSTGGSPNRLTEDVLAEHEALDLYTVVQRLRPQWLRVRGTVTAQGQATIAIILDGVRQQGSTELLRGMRTAEVRELRYMNARDATTRYGTDMVAGAIEIFTKR